MLSVQSKSIVCCRKKRSKSCATTLMHHVYWSVLLLYLGKRKIPFRCLSTWQNGHCGYPCGYPWIPACGLDLLMWIVQHCSQVLKNKYGLKKRPKSPQPKSPMLVIVALLGFLATHSLATPAQAVPQTITLSSRTIDRSSRFRTRAISSSTIPLRDFFSGTDLQSVFYISFSFLS